MSKSKMLENLERNYGYQVENAESTAKRAQNRLALFKKFSFAEITQALYEGKKALGIPWTTRGSVSITADGLEAAFYKNDATYDEVLELDNAMLGYSGKYMSGSIEAETKFGKAILKLECRLPADETSILRSIGKIEDRVEVSTTTTC